MGIDQVLLEYAGKGAGSLALLAVGWIGSKKGIKKLRAIFNPHDVYADAAIQTALDELKVKTGAIHTWLSQYSNGKESFAGLCFKHFTIISESSAIGREKIKSYYRNIPAEDFTDFRKSLLEADQYFTWTPDKEIDTPVPYQIHGIVKVFEWKLKNSDVNVGHVSLCFDEDVELTDTMKHHLNHYSRSIRGLIKLTKK